jgi:hypothetical protein
VGHWRDSSQALVNMVKKLWGSIKCGDFFDCVKIAGLSGRVLLYGLTSRSH